MSSIKSRHLQPKPYTYKYYTLGTAPTQQQSILGILLRAIFHHIIILIQLLLRGPVPKLYIQIASPYRMMPRKP